MIPQRAEPLPTVERQDLTVRHALILAGHCGVFAIGCLQLLPAVRQTDCVSAA